MRVGVSAVQIRASKSKPYGQTARLPIQSGEAAVLIWPALSADLPPDAVVTSAILRMSTGPDAWTGTRQLMLGRLNGQFWTGSATWANAPSNEAAAVTLTVGPKPARSPIDFDVTAHVQAIMSGGWRKWGWRLWTNDATWRLLSGNEAPTGRPHLLVEYEVPAKPPADLSPQGVVSSPKPTLTATVPRRTLGWQVRIDANFGADSAIDWTSPEVPVDGAVASMDLADTSFGGIPTGGTYWAARTRTTLGWSAWSPWAAMSSLAFPALAITSPAATTGDNTAPVTWTISTQYAYRVRIERLNGALIDGSGWVASSTARSWTPTKPVPGGPGTRFRVVVDVRDVEDRVATAGRRPFTRATTEVELVEAGAAAGVTGLTAHAAHGSPWTELRWTSADTPDGWQVRRDGEWLARVPGSAREYVDVSAQPGVLHEYRVLRVMNAAVSPNGPTVRERTEPVGIWLRDSEGRHVYLLGEDAPEVEYLTQEAVHEVIGAPPVRRVLADLPPSGTQSGMLADDPTGQSAREAEAILLDWRESGDPTDEYRLVTGHWNWPVTLSAINVGSTATATLDWLLPASLAFHRVPD